MSRQKIIAVGLAIVFFVAGHFFLKAYNRYALDRDMLQVLSKQSRLLKKRQSEQVRKKRALERVNSFVSHVNSLGLVRDQWTNYNVNIEEPVSFPAVEQILMQTANSSSYYFKPVMVHVKTKFEPDTGTRPDKQAATSADSPEVKKGDVLLTLKGAFVVKGK